jgi:hypothetical protein
MEHGMGWRALAEGMVQRWTKQDYIRHGLDGVREGRLTLGEGLLVLLLAGVGERKTRKLIQLAYKNRKT